MSKKINGNPGYTRLPGEKITPASLLEVIIMITGVCCIVLAANFIAGRYLEQYTPNSGYWLLKHKWEKVLNMKSSVEWLVLGDSSGNQGVVPAVLTDTLGGHSINLCTFGDMTIVNDIWMLESYIKKFGPPGNVLIVRSYDGWGRKMGRLLGKIPLPWGFWGDYEQPFKPDLIGQVKAFVTRYVPLFTENSSLAEIIINGIYSPQTFFVNRFGIPPDGYMAGIISKPLLVRNDMDTHVKFLANNRFTVSGHQHEALYFLSELADRYGINVYISNGPIYKDLAERILFIKYMQQLKSYMSQFSKKSTYFHYIEPVMTFPAHHMQSVDHVIHPAAIQFTERIAAVISIEE